MNDGTRRGFERRPPPRGPAKPGTPVPLVTPARLVALDALLDVTRSGAYASLALDQRIKRTRLNNLDRRLAAEIAYGTLEQRLYIDWLLEQYMERMPEDATLREVLRMSVYQILFLERVPDDAVCSQAANLLRARNLQGFGPLCFAVLKRIAREKDSLPSIPEDDEAVRLSLTYSVPQWIVAKLLEQYGKERALAFLRYKPRHGTTTVYINPMRASGVEDAVAALGGAEPCAVGGAYRVRGDAAQSDAFHQGMIGIQGEASQLCAQLTGASRGQRVLDVCAAPGGKACYMAIMMQGSGRVVAWDVHEHRVELIAKTARRLGLENVRASVWDATREKDEYRDVMDAVLVDAPCSGLGMLHEKPDIRYRIRPEEAAELPKLQAQLLERAATFVKPGGVLVYATCTLFREENDDIISAFLQAHPEFAPDLSDSLLPEAWRDFAPGHGRGLTLWPQDTGGDGFFMMRMKRAR